MKYRIVYEWYKTFETCYEFIGTEEEWEVYKASQGGVFTVVEKTPL